MGLIKAELDFYTRVPQLLAELVSEMKKLNSGLSSYKGNVEQIKG